MSTTSSLGTFYRNISEENSVKDISRFFQSLGNRETVSASLGYSVDGSPPTDAGISSACMTAIHNHLDSAKMWKMKSPWATEVEYTIPHPSGDVTAFDTNSGGDATLTRNSVVLSKTGSCANHEGCGIFLLRVSAQPSDKMDMNTQRYSRVRVMNVKRFFYETDRSSWVFKLVVAWEGATKEAAKASSRRYFVSVESQRTHNVKTSSNPAYSAASFLDKVLDIISLDGRRQILTF